MNDVQLQQLFPDTAYAVSLHAVHGDSASLPLGDRGVTRTSALFHWDPGGFTAQVNNTKSLSGPLPPSGKLNVNEVTHSSMRLYWDAATGPVDKYIVTYKPEGGEVLEVHLILILSLEHPLYPGWMLNVFCPFDV